MVILQKRVAGLNENSLERFLTKAKRAVGLRGAVTVLVTSSQELRRLNQRFRGQDRPTDVLSFPAEMQPASGFAGDVAISAEIAAQNARQLGHSAAEEVKILVLHGILHLAGFDHEADSGQMARKEERLRKQLRLSAALIERSSGPGANDRRRVAGNSRRQTSTDEPLHQIAEARAMSYAVGASLLLLVGLLTLVSYVDRLYTEIGKFLSREFQDNIDSFEKNVEPNLRASRARASLSMAILVQVTMAAIALSIGFIVFSDKAWSFQEILQATLSLVLIVIVFNRFLPFVFFSRTNGEWLARWVPVLRILIYLVLPVTLMLGFLQSVASLTKRPADEEPESPAEAVDALIEAGQEEGIIQASDRDLIQSVVEFSGKTVREAMKPRPEMVAVPVNTTVEQFVELLRTKPFSRVPVYRDSIHSIVGIVYAQDVLQVPDTEARARTVESLMRKEVYFVPESKLGSHLLREMRKNNVRMAIVVDEYGGVAGLVTIEDLVEEIVGEIGDEHEKSQVIKENDHAYIVPGNMDVDRSRRTLWDSPGRQRSRHRGRAGDGTGRPHSAEGRNIEEDGLRFEVLESTDRRVERVRIVAVEPRQMKLI